MNKSRQPVLEFRDVCFGYSSVETIHNASFVVREGAFVAVVGPNGGGKTTLIKLALGLIKPQRGKILLFGRDPTETRARVGYVPQIMMFDPHFPVRVKDVVRMGRVEKVRWGMYRKADDASVLDALEKVEAIDLMNKAFSDLSGGERQRVILAQALIGHPELLILDEPTANVDAVVEKRLYDLLKKINETITIFLVSHNLNVVTKHADHVLCVNHTADLHPIDAVSKSSMQSVSGADLTVLFHADNCPVTDPSRYMNIDHRADLE
ncbi:MAG: ABC transporter ATP-binding protein [bacterium]